MKLHKDAPQLQGKDWKAIFKMAVEAYNHHEHRATGMTPEEAVKPSNTPQVKQSLEHHRVSSRHYPSLKAGDEVRLYKKKNALDKECLPLWSDKMYKVIATKTEFDQTFYKIDNNKNRFYIRSELLKIE